MTPEDFSEKLQKIINETFILSTNPDKVCIGFFIGDIDELIEEWEESPEEEKNS